MKYKVIINGEEKTIDAEKFNANRNAILQKYPDAQIRARKDDVPGYIPVSQYDKASKSGFVFEELDDPIKKAEPIKKTTPVEETTPRPYSADKFIEGKGKDTKVAGVPYNVWQGLKPESKQFYYKDYENRLKEEKAKADELSATDERDRLIKEGNQKEIEKFKESPLLSALGFAFTNNQNPEVQTSQMVIDKSKDVQKQIKADREKTGGFGDVVRGFKDNASAIASFGIGEMESNLTLLNAAKKYEKGEPLSKPEKKLLDVAALEASVNQSTDPGTGYRIGYGAAESLGYMKDFAITPGMGIFGRAAVRRFGTIAAEKTIAQIAKNAALRVGGDVIGAMGMASTVHAPRVFGDAYNRNLGDITPDENGYVGRSEGDAPLKALAKAFGSTVVEDYSEMVGSYFKAVTKPLGKAAGKVADKIGLEKVHKLIADVPASEWAKTVTDIQNRGQFSGVLEEYGEELVGTALNAAIVGDSKFSDLVDPKQQAETFMSVGLISGLIGGVKLSGYRGPKREAQKRLNSSINEIESALGEVKATEIISKLQNADDTQKSVIIDSLDEEVKPLVKEYVARESYLHGLELAKIKRRAEGEVPAEQLELEDSYEEGLSSEPDNSFKVKLDESKSGVEKMAERFNVDPETLFTGLDSGDPLSLIGVAYENSKEDGDALLNYYNAKAAYDGLIDGVRDNIDSQIESQKKEIKRRTAEDGNIYDVTLKTSNDVHYNIVKGMPAFNEDGTVDYANSPDYVFLRDDKGEVRMEPKDNLFKLTSKQDSNSVLSELEERIRMSEAQKAADKIDGVRDFQIGEAISVPTPDGPVNAVVNNVSEDGVEIQTESPIDGKSVMIMPKRELSDRLQQEFPKTEENTEIKEPEKVEPTTEESSNLSEETPVIDSRPEEEIKQSVTYPRDKGGFIDYSNIEDSTVYANALKEEFGTDALDVVNENISDIQKKIKKAENRPSAIERVRAKKALQLELDKMNQVKKILNPITEDVKTDRDYIDWVLDNSDDINEVKAAYDASKEFNEELQPWQKELLGRKISPNSFKRFGDRNKISGTFAKGWLKKDGEDIDVLAQELSGFGREVSEGDIIDFMLSNPTNRVRTTNDIQLELNKKFSELATKEMGFPVGGPESSTGKLYLMNKDKENKISLMPAIKEDISSQEQSYLDGIPEEELSKLAKARDEEMFNRYSEVLDNGMTIEEMEELESELYGNRGSETEIVAPTAQEEATGGGGEELRSSVQGLSDSNDSGARGENTEPAQVGPSFVAPEFKDGDLFDYAEKVVKSKEIQDAEKEVNSSPTEAQKQAGNYKKGHVKIGPYNVTIENPKGSVRSGVDANGKEWSITMNNTYGYFKGTKGKDGDQIDVFIGDNPSPKTVYVVDQVNNDGSFDEHKVLWGFDSEQSAKDAYLSNYEDGWQGLGNITGVPVEDFNKWVESSKRKTKPFSEYKSIPKKVNKVSFGLNADKYLHNQTNDKDVRVFDAEIEDNGNGTFTISSLNRIKSLDGVDDVVDVKGKIPLADAKNYKVIEKGRIKLNDNGIYEVVSPLKIELVSDSDVRFRDGKFEREINQDEIYDYISENTDNTSEPSRILDELKDYYGGEIVAASSGAKHALENGMIPFAGSKYSGANEEYHHFRLENGDIVSVPFKDIRFREDSSPAVSPQEEIRNTLQSLSEKMGVPVKMINSEEVSNDNKSMEKRMKNSKGWYDVSSGDVVIITSNATSVNDAKRTFLHEVVGHKGLRSLMGEEFDSFLDKVKKQLPADVSKDMKDNTDVEEYLARIAEMDETPSFFGKIKAVVREFLRKYMDVELSDNDVKYILWTSKNNLEKNSVFRNAANESMKDKMFRDENSVEAIIRNAKQDGTYMKAPNGEPTKLTEKQWAQVRTQEFKDWFGDWQNNPEEASKVVDENGEPLVVYHGTSKPLFYSFDPLKSNPVLSGGMYFSNSKDLSQKFSGSKGNLYSVFLSIKNPERNGFDGSGSDMSPSEYRDGGIFVKRKSDKYAVKGTREYIVFNPNQIKSATDNVGSFDPNNPDIRFRDGENYDDKFKGSLYKFQESYQDSMLGLKKLQESIEKETGKIEDFENAYIHENQLSSKNSYEAEFYHTNFFTPIVKEMSKILKVKSREEFNQYLISKHGLERNVVFAQRDARNEAKEDTKIERSNLEFALYKNLIDKQAYDSKMLEIDKKEDKAYRKYLGDKMGQDYSGLSSIYQEDFENKAKEYVELFEADVNTSSLWDNINNATKETLRKTYTSGLMGKENYDNINDMFSYYVPLRGWKEDTAADVYNYIELDRPVFNAPVVTAKGRLSVSDDPIATIANMAESAILQGNRNLMKQKFLNMALNHKTPLLTVKEMWYVNNGTDKAPDWVESLPDIPEGATAEEVSEAVEAHYNLMRDLQKEGRAKKDKKGLNISYRANDREKRQHAVVVKRNGKEQVVFVNGNPRAAQAVNGLTNPDAVSHKLIEWIGWANRQLAANFTTRNPAFVLSNLSRDLIFSSSAVLIKEDGKYSKRFTSNLPKTTANIAGLMKRRYKGELRDFGMDKYFKEFLENGGETGYSMLTSVDEYKKLIEKDLLKLDGKVDIGRIIGLKPGKVTTPTTLGIVPALKSLASFIEFSNKCAEDISRFNTYLTSRQMGRTVVQSINDAKEVTVNFNKKGAGGWGATTAKSLYLFLNAAVQSLTNFYRLGKNNPIKFSGVVGGFVSAGILIPMFNQMLMNMFGGDDDSYDNLPEWVRKNNFCLWLGGDSFLTIPLPIELRAFYGMGEMFTQWSGGKMKGENVGLKMIGQITELLPLDPMGTGAAVPDAVKPIWQSYTNEDFFGKPIYKKTPFNEDMPEYTKAFKGTNKQLVESAEFLNEITGGDKYTKGSIDLNPSIAEHLVEGYLGGMGKTLNQTWKTISMIWDEDQRVMRNVPVANRFLSETDEKNAFSRVGKAYNNYRKEYDLTNQRLKGYEKEADKGVFEFAEKANSLYNSPEYKRYEVFKEYQKEIDYLYDELKTADGAEKASLNNTLNLTKTQLVEALDAIE